MSVTITAMLRTNPHHESDTLDAASTITRVCVESLRSSLAKVLPCYPDISARKIWSVDADESCNVYGRWMMEDEVPVIVNNPGFKNTRSLRFKKGQHPH